MAERDTTAVLAEELASALHPLASALESPDALRDFLEDLGWDFDVPPAALDSLRAPVEQLIAIIDLDQPITGGQVGQLLSSVRVVFTAIGDLQSAVGLANDFRNEFPHQLIEYLVAEYMLTRRARWGYLLITLGILRLEKKPADGSRPPYLRRVFAFDDLTNLLQNPLAFLKNSYQWGQSGFGGERLLQSLYGLFDSADFQVRETLLDAQTLNQLNSGALQPEQVFRSALQLVLIEDIIDPNLLSAGVGLFLLPETNENKPGFALLPFATAGLNHTLNISDRLKLSFEGDINLAGGAGVLVRPNRDVEFLVGLNSGAPAAASGNLAIQLRLAKPGEPFLLLGSPSASRFELAGVSTTAGTRFYSAGKFEVFTEFALEQGKIVIQPGANESDGFLARLLPKDGVQVPTDLTVGFSSTRGLYFGGSGGLEINLPAHSQLGPVETQSVLLGVKFKDGAIHVEFAITVKGEFSVVEAVVENIGAKAIFTFPPDRKGNLGPVNMEMAFRPPNGVGLTVDAGVIKGGGYHAFNQDKEEYSGILQLQIAEKISVNAIGVLTTRMPDGSRGYSFAAIITASDFPGINLGFGFQLTGVGGIMGLDRTFDFAKLEQKLKAGVLRNLLFPPNPVANATAILADMTQVFPAARDHYVFGLMFRITWGSEKLVVIDLAVIIAETVAILGIVDVYFPRFDFAQVEVHVHVIGELDVGRKRIFVHAEIINTSHIFGFKLSGGAAMLLTWGEEPVFILSFGGFNKRYEQQLPPGFPALDRLTVPLVNTKNLTATLRMYLAVTSNSVQIGGSFALKAGVGKLTIEGGLTVDALLQFYAQPRFIFDLDACLELKAWGVTLFSVRVQGMLSGGSPWHARGKATFKIFIFSCSVDFDEVWGDAAADESLPETDVRSLVIEAFKDSRNWTAELPPETQGLVTLREPVSGTGAMLHPLSALAITQRVAPLNVSLTRFGNGKPQGQNFFKIEKVLVGTSNILEGSSSFTIETVREHFARSQFLDMTDDEKLESPAFEKMDCGVRLGTAPVRHAAPVTATMLYQTLKYNRATKKLEDAGVKVISDTVLDQLVGTGAAASAPSAVRAGVPPPVVKIAPFKYVVATVKNQSAVTEDRTITYTQAVELMRAKVAGKTYEKTQLQVLEVTK